MIKVLIVDDLKLIRLGTSSLLDNVSGIKVIGDAASGEEALEMVRKNRPHVVLMDLDMPGMGGMAAMDKLRLEFPEIPTIILTMYGEAPYPSRLLKAGAMGYLHKGCSPDEMVEAIHAVIEGKKYLSKEVAQSVAMTAVTGGRSVFEALSKRELQVAIMLAKAKRVKQIAEELFLSVKTVSTYRSRILKKLHLDNEVELTLLALRHGLIDDSVVVTTP